jgi:O-antigen ligase
MLSSKLIIVVFVVLFLVNYFFYTKSAQKLRMRNLMIFVLLVGSVLFFGKIKERFAVELQANNEKSISHTVLEMQNQGIHIVSVYEAWNNEKFTPNDFFPGTAFRVYQARMLKELFQEESPWLTGYGLEGSYKKLEEKAIQYGVFLGNEQTEGYQKKNFHNQYLQFLADLGIFGLLILVFILIILVKNVFSTKDFVPIAFTILMISLFLTESFLWRQRGIVFFTVFALMMLPKETKHQQ